MATLGVAQYLTVVRRARALIHESGRKAYTLAVGKVNPAKLANFAEVSQGPTPQRRGTAEFD